MPSSFDAWIDLSEMDLLFSLLRSSEILHLSLLDDDNVEDEDYSDENNLSPVGYVTGSFSGALY